MGSAISWLLKVLEPLLASASRSVSSFSHVFTLARSGSVEQYYRRVAYLGEGSYGQVYEARDVDLGAPRAIKVVQRDKLQDETRFLHEVEIQKRLDHPNVVKLHEFFQDPKHIYLVMELCNGGELLSRIVSMFEGESGGESESESDRGDRGNAGADRGGGSGRRQCAAFCERTCVSYMQQILRAVNYLHSNSVVHRDVKPENFLMQSGAIKLIDFGLSKVYTVGQSELMCTVVGTPSYVAPEVLTRRYTEKCDVWSCGVVLYVLLCGELPFSGSTTEEILQGVRSASIDFAAAAAGASCNRGKGEAGKDDRSPITGPTLRRGAAADAAGAPLCRGLLERLLCRRVWKRYSAAQALEDEWMAPRAQERLRADVSKDLYRRLRRFTGLSKFKKVCLTIAAQQVDDHEIQELRDTFKILDANGDGAVSYEEIVEAFVQNGIPVPGQLKSVVLSLDTDNSGTVDYSEFLAATIQMRQCLTRDALRAVFRVFDVDGNNQIDLSELQKTAFRDSCRIGARPGMPSLSLQAEMESRRLFRELDTDNDGVISFDEFEAYMCANMQRTSFLELGVVDAEKERE